MQTCNKVYELINSLITKAWISKAQQVDNMNMIDKNQENGT